MFVTWGDTMGLKFVKKQQLQCNVVNFYSFILIYQMMMIMMELVIMLCIMYHPHLKSLVI